MSDIQKYSQSTAKSRLSSLIEHLLKSYGKKTRVIISGGYQDDWQRHHIDVDSYFIPEGTTRINVGSYDLDLVAQLDDSGTLRKVEVAKPEEKSIELDYNYFMRIWRVTTLITEDGRIYHDKELFNGPNSHRLESLLESLKDSYSQGNKTGFDLIYSERS